MAVPLLVAALQRVRQCCEYESPVLRGRLFFFVDYFLFRPPTSVFFIRSDRDPAVMYTRAHEAFFALHGM